MPKNRTRIVEYIQKRGMSPPEGEGWLRGRFNPRTGDQQWIQRRIRTTPSNIGRLAEPFERLSRMGVRNTTRRVNNRPSVPSLGGPVLAHPTFGNASNINYGPIIKPAIFDPNRTLSKKPQEGRVNNEDVDKEDPYGLGNLSSLFRNTGIKGGRMHKSRKGKKTKRTTTRRR